MKNCKVQKGFCLSLPPSVTQGQDPAQVALGPVVHHLYRVSGIPLRTGYRNVVGGPETLHEILLRDRETTH